VQTLAKLDSGETPSRSKQTVAEVAEAFLEGAKAGTIRNRKGRFYKPSTLRGIEALLNSRVIPTFGRERLDAVTRPRLQRWVRTLLEDGLSGSTVRNTINAVRVIYRQAVRDGELSTNPTTGLELPAVDKHEPRFVAAKIVSAMLEALPIRDRAIWATAFYAGLRRGELWGVRRGNVDRGEGIIRVRHGEDAMEGRIDPKSDAGIRLVPIPGQLAEILDEYDAYLLDKGRPLGEDDRYFPGERSDRFSHSALIERAQKHWTATDLEAVGLHDARHTYASLMIAAGVNAKALCTYMGHSSIQVTFDRYGHLFPGNEAEAAALLDAYLTNDLKRDQLPLPSVPDGVPSEGAEA
jgi:integrase